MHNIISGVRWWYLTNFTSVLLPYLLNLTENNAQCLLKAQASRDIFLLLFERNYNRTQLMAGGCPRSAWAH